MLLRSCQNGAKTGHVLGFHTWPRGMSYPGSRRWTYTGCAGAKTGHALGFHAWPRGMRSPSACRWTYTRCAHLRARKLDMSSASTRGHGACPRLASTAGHVPQQVGGRSPDRARPCRAQRSWAFRDSRGRARPGPSGSSSPEGAAWKERSGRSGPAAGSPKEPATGPNTPTPKACHMFDKTVTRRSGPRRSSSVLWNP